MPHILVYLLFSAKLSPNTLLVQFEIPQGDSSLKNIQVGLK
jgi:hypothetical protein